jgi:integrase
MFAYLTDIKVLANDPILPLKPVRIKRADHAQGPYTAEEVEAISAHIEHGVKPREEKERSYEDPSQGDATLLLEGGCDLIDAVQFGPGQIGQMKAGGTNVWVYQYYRKKTGELPVVPMRSAIVSVLQNIPMLDTNSRGMPFRSQRQSPKAKTDVADWSRRIAMILRAAGIRYVTLPVRGSKGTRQRPAKAKQLRQTFAVNRLEAGVRPEQAARMLGHVDTQMVYRHYAPFIDRLKEAHVRLVMENWA